jgi:uncharacterized protein (DUF1800 family)
MLLKWRPKSLAGAFLALALVGCSGGGGGSTAAPPIVVQSLSDADAARFLTQASFGPTDADIAALKPQGYAAWLTQQTSLLPSASHQSYVETRLTQLQSVNPKATLSASQFYESFWLQANTAPDQLRQRLKLALSEIFVISLLDPNVDVRGAASYYDTLGVNAFGNFRDLLQAVTLHPMMGVYLTSLANQKEDATTGRHPDENYAREVMQLMTLGLYQLNIDGSTKLDTSGAPIPSYNANDISGLAKVFTGMSWYSPSPTNTTFFGGAKDPNATVTPMTLYPGFHSVSQKDFLGVTIAAQTTPDPAADLKIALDTLFNHPNVGPFIARRLIQQLVTSNPSPGYISRVASAFNNNGSGVRGDMAAVIRTLLTDPEARDIGAVNSTTFGKLREPVVRLANWMRAFGATSASGNYLVGSTSASTSLAQSALAAPSVFNFWRPGYVPPNTRLGAQNLTAPEFQAVDEVSVAGYLNTMQSVINTGIGTSNDVSAAYANEVAIANDPAMLADRMSKLLLYGQMSANLKAKVIDAVSSVAVPSGTATQAQISAALLNRAKLAAFMTMASPEYLAQR